VNSFTVFLCFYILTEVATIDVDFSFEDTPLELICVISILQCGNALITLFDADLQVFSCGIVNHEVQIFVYVQLDQILKS
jgi:hypothetical protein